MGRAALGVVGLVGVAACSSGSTDLVRDAARSTRASVTDAADTGSTGSSGTTAGTGAAVATASTGTTPPTSPVSGCTGATLTAVQGIDPGVTLTLNQDGTGSFDFTNARETNGRQLGGTVTFRYTATATGVTLADQQGVVRATTTENGATVTQDLGLADVAALGLNSALECTNQTITVVDTGATFAAAS